MFVIKKQEIINKTIRMPDDLIEQLEEIASLENISFNQLVVQCCEYAIKDLQRGNSNSLKIKSAADFSQNKKQYRIAFLKYMEQNSPKATPQSASQIFTDGIFASQPRNSALNVDFYKLLTGETTLEEYERILQEYFQKSYKKSTKALAKSYVNRFVAVRDFLKQAEYI